MMHEGPCGGHAIIDLHRIDVARYKPLHLLQKCYNPVPTPGPLPSLPTDEVQAVAVACRYIRLHLSELDV